MIQLHPDYLLFQTSNGETIPCSAELVAIELMGSTASNLDPQVIHHAASAVLHYFKTDLNREFVSIGEFSEALEKVLVELGYTVISADKASTDSRIVVSNLIELAAQSGTNFELSFFGALRTEVHKHMQHNPELLRFDGLRQCVKYLKGTKRWNRECQVLSDQIVTYLRGCLESELDSGSCRVIIH